MADRAGAPVLRFAVVSEDGRRSCEWRIWTGTKRPTDHTYLAPRSMGGQLKISLHADGWCQHGLTGKHREAVRPSDSHVLDRWRLGPARDGWHMPIILTFPDSQLDFASGLGEGTVRVSAPGPGRCISILVFVGNATSDEHTVLDGWADSVVGRLPRADGGSVLLLAARTKFDDHALRASVAAFGGPSWELPMGLAEEAFGWVAQNRTDDIRGFVEINSNRISMPGGAPHISGFVGSIRPWVDLPDDALRNRDDLCGVLVCGSQSGPILFVDQRARCDHRDLGATASALVAEFDDGVHDGGWDEVAPGIFLTGLLTAQSAERRALAGRGIPSPRSGQDAAE